MLDSTLSGWTEVLPAANADTKEAVFAKRSSHAAAGMEDLPTFTNFS